jgi:hypothetical protein
MTIVLKLRKLLTVPGPQALGMAECDALGDREFTPFQEGPTWQDWDARVRVEYPLRYFVSETIGGWVSLRYGQVTRVLRGLRYRWLPWHRYHLIDLSDVDTLWPYEYEYPPGASGIMKLAAWKALRLHIEQDKPEDPTKQDYSPEFKEEQWYLDAKIRFEEKQALYHYWVTERAEEQATETRLHQAVREAAHRRDREAYDARSQEWLAYAHAIEVRESEMFQRLMKLQPYLIGD